MKQLSINGPVKQQEAQLLLGWPTVLPHSRRSMQKLWRIDLTMLIHRDRGVRAPKIPWQVQTYAVYLPNKPIYRRFQTKFRCHDNKGWPYNILHGSIESVISENPLVDANICGLSVIQATIQNGTDRQTTEWDRRHAVPKARPKYGRPKTEFLFSPRWTQTTTCQNISSSLNSTAAILLAILDSTTNRFCYSYNRELGCRAQAISEML